MSSTAPGHRSVNAPRRTDGGDKRPKGSSKNDVSHRNQSNQQSINQNSKSARPDSNHVNSNSSSKTSDNASESKSKRVVSFNNDDCVISDLTGLLNLRMISK